MTKTLVLGELHGTRETPEIVGEIACHLAMARIPITIALEIPASEQFRLDSFLAFESIPAAALATGEYWHSKRPDGRTSVAMLEMLERLRGLRMGGASVRVLAFDTSYPYDPLPGTRDQRMAQRLFQVRQDSPDDTIVVLVGANHARKSIGRTWDPSFEPMVHALRRFEPTTQSFVLVPQNGSSWGCNAPSKDSCGEHMLDEQPDGEILGFVPSVGEDLLTYDGVFGLGTVHSSPPVCPALTAP